MSKKTSNDPNSRAIGSIHVVALGFNPALKNFIGFKTAKPSKIWRALFPYMDSNHDRLNQNQACYRYTIREYCGCKYTKKIKTGLNTLMDFQPGHFKQVFCVVGVSAINYIKAYPTGVFERMMVGYSAIL